MITLMEKGRQIHLSVLLIVAIALYYWGYDLCHYLYNQYDYEAGSLIRKQVAKKFWDLRFSNYSVIIAIVLYTNRFKLNKLNKSIAKVGYNLAFISAVDKLVFNDFDFSKFDILILIMLIFWEIYLGIKSKHKDYNET